MQLNASLRKRSPSVHRASGYVFFLSCGLLTAGFFIIDQRQLHAKNIWMPDTDDAHPFLERLPLHAIMAWFVITALLAWYQAAIRRDFKAHQRFMYRHLAAGLWVAVQRILYAAEIILFEGAAVVAIFCCLGVTELSLSRHGSKAIKTT
eukprot:CAMPEP_0117648086 /NCGR_PEP_ID=MMETSP0804-20121206/201_1 /TAXON_ID=1074897 /ORGANISM="Tetraselmis astigmatica, Strain CCMP880" /LENGTH=148 /DNA_ID=CAMNT_0005453633 /DNA_START=381 /DNA_END=827 /DNA_ORIENTATION=-